MAKSEKFARIIIKRTNDAVILPTIPTGTTSRNDHTLLPAWKTSDIYIGEFFLNEIQERLWIRVSETKIKEVCLEPCGGGGGSGTSGTSGKDGVFIGSSGTSGSSGITGTSGSSGVGTNGTSGSSGVGTNGTSGSSGSSGTNGADGTFFGTSGSSGITGTSGSSGITGTSGSSGTTGISGSSGTSGSSGKDGIFYGTHGTSGSSGLTGTNGTSGSSGVGTSGTSGSSGSSGMNGSVPYEEISFDLNLIGVTDIFIDDYTWYTYAISGVSIRSNLGTCNLDFRINNVNIVGISSLTSTTTAQRFFATTPSTTNVNYTGGQLKIAINSTSGATRLFGSIKIYRI